MTQHQAARLWDSNADARTALSRAGYDTYRDSFNTPAFLEMLPGIDGLSGLDIGCGEGTNTRLLAGLGARMTAIDISRRFVDGDVPAREGLGTRDRIDPRERERPRRPLSLRSVESREGSARGRAPAIGGLTVAISSIRRTGGVVPNRTRTCLSAVG